MDQTFEGINDYPMLTDSQRIQARRSAEKNIVEKYARKPRRADFNDYAARRFPLWLTILVSAALAFVAITAGVISGMRLYYAGYEYFYATIPNRTQAQIAGYFTPLAAEVLVIVAAIAVQMYMHRQNKARYMALVPIAVGTIVAFVGNWQISKPDSLWGWVETCFPPIAVLSVAFFFEITLVPEMERLQANNTAYNLARADYDQLVNCPQDHPHWLNTYGWSLWEMWANVYRNVAEISEIQRETRQAIALREMGADTFFEGDVSLVSRNSRQSQQAPNVSKKQVMKFLKDNPEMVNAPGVEIAAETGASPATVSRAKRAISSNGHGG